MNGAYGDLRGYFGDAQQTAQIVTAVAPEAGSSLSYEQIYTLAPTIARTVAEATGSPAQRAAVLRAQLQTAIAEGRPLRTVNELRARVAAADQEAQAYAATQQRVGEWAELGKAFVGAGIALFGVTGLAIMVRTFRG